MVAVLAIHFAARAFSARRIAKKLLAGISSHKNLVGEHKILAGNIQKAFLKNTQPLRSVFRPVPVGWSMRTRRVLTQVHADACEFIQTMNDRYTRPSGEELPEESSDARQADAGEMEPKPAVVHAPSFAEGERQA